MSVKATEAELKSLAEVKVTCVLVKREGSSETTTKVMENGEEIYDDKVVRKKQKVDHVNVDVGSIIREGTVHTSDIKLQLRGQGDVELMLSYHPKGFDDQK